MKWRIKVLPWANLDSSITTVNQVHGATIVDATRAQHERLDADGILMRPSDQPVAIHTTDCLPLIITSDKSALALHISRKTLIHGLLDHVPSLIKPEDIRGVFFGPHICAKHFIFEHEGEDITRFREKFPAALTGHNPIYLSLKSAVQTYLKTWHVSSDFVHEDPRCTFEDESLPSYKRKYVTGNATPLGRIATIVYSPKD